MREFWQRKRADGTRGGPWWTNLFGRRVSTGQPTIGLARTWKAGKLLDGANPRLAAAKRARLDDAIREFMRELVRRGRSAGTIKKNKGKLGHFPRLWRPEFKLANINAALVDAYIDARLKDPGARTGTKVARITISDELGALRQVLKLAKRQGRFPYPIDEVLPLVFDKKHTPRKDYVPFDKLWSLLKALPEHRVAHVLFFTVTGGRTADSFRARREDFDCTEWRITVRGSKTKGSARTIPVPEFLRWNVAHLLARAPGEDLLFEAWSEGSMNRDIKAACRRAGLKPVSTNGLRRTFGHALRVNGYSLDLISKLFGHTTEKLARDVYADFSEDELAAAVAKQGKA